MGPSLSVCRLLQEQMEQSLSDTQHRLSVKMNELHAAHGQIEKLEDRIGEYMWTAGALCVLCVWFQSNSSVCLFLCVCATVELNQKDSKHKEEVAVLQKSISALDRAKDALQDEVDQKTERLVALQEENSQKVATVSTIISGTLPHV